MGRQRRLLVAAIFAALALCAAGALFAGDIPVKWTAPTDPRITHTRVFYGPGSVTAASPYKDIAYPGDRVTLTGLTDCTLYHVAAKTCIGQNTATECSAAFSPVVKGWPDIRVTGVTFDVAGMTVVTGSNFGPSTPTPVKVRVDGVAVTPTSVTCTEIKFPARAGAVVEVESVQADGYIEIGRYSVPLAPPAGFGRTDP